MTSDVIIVGGGPVGLLLAIELKLAGVSPVVLERLAEPNPEPKANGLVGRVVQAMDYRGLYQRLAGTDTPPAPQPGYMFGAFTLDLTDVGEHSLYILGIPQRRLEQHLEERALELGVPVERGSEVVGFTEDADGVTVGVAGPAGRSSLRSRYLVGCDGGHSTVRKLAGIDFPGVTSENVVARQAHVALPASMITDGVLEVPGAGRFPLFRYHRTEAGIFVVASFEPGVHMVVTMEWDTDVPDTAMSIAELRESVRRVLGADLPMGPPLGPGPHVLRRLSGGNSRQADRYRVGRVLLAGDAAHVHSAVGGPGLNLGLQDVLNLGWKLAAEIHGWAPAGLLDTYESERQPVGQRVVIQTQAQSALLKPGPEVTALRAVFGELLADPAAKRRIADLVAGADTRYDMRTKADHPLVGRWMPDLTLPPTGSDAAQVRVAELLRTGRAVLLDLDGRDDAAKLTTGWADRVDVIRAKTPDAPAAVVLIRPDGYVAWAGDPAGPEEGSEAGLEGALRTWFGPSR